MSTASGGAAFPGPAGIGKGMSLRDWFAGQVIAASNVHDYANSAIAVNAYAIADAMLAERAKAATAEGP